MVTKKSRASRHIHVSKVMVNQDVQGCLAALKPGINAVALLPWLA